MRVSGMTAHASERATRLERDLFRGSTQPGTTGTRNLGAQARNQERIRSTVPSMDHSPFQVRGAANGISNFHRTSKRTVKRVEWSERVGRDSRAERGRMLGSDSAESDENESERASTVRAYGIGEGNETKEKDRTSSAG